MPNYEYIDSNDRTFTFSPKPEDIRRALAEIYYEHYFKKIWRGDRTTMIHALENMIFREELDENKDILDYWFDELKEYFEEDAYEEHNL